MRIAMAFLAGLSFGLGLVLSGMSDPARVLGFLDLAGAWNPSLAFVMGGALLVASIGFRIADGRKESLLGEPMRLPVATRIDRRLVVGALAFGTGWGLAGFCPGPALVAFAQGGSKPATFMMAMLAGMALHDIHGRLAQASQKPS